MNNFVPPVLVSFGGGGIPCNNDTNIPDLEHQSGNVPHYKTEQLGFAFYDPNFCGIMTNLPPPHMDPRVSSTSPTAQDSCLHSLGQSSCFNAARERPIAQVYQGTRDLVNPWLADMLVTSSSVWWGSSESSSLGIATPPPSGEHSPPWVEQLQLPASRLIEQPIPPRLNSTGTLNWLNTGDGWGDTNAEDLSGNGRVMAPSSFSNTTDCCGPSDMPHNHAHTGNRSVPPFTSAAQSQMPLTEAKPTEADTGKAGDDDKDKDTDSPDDEESDSSQSVSSASRAMSNAGESDAHVGRWRIPSEAVQQKNVRGYLCSVTGCTAGFVRPEHLQRHIKIKHTNVRLYECRICKRSFTRRDNMRDHYWTHLERNGAKGKNEKFPLSKLKRMLELEERLVKRLRKKQKQHNAKEKTKKLG